MYIGDALSVPFIVSCTDFMQTGNLFFLWGGNREQKCFWATRDNRKWKYLFSFQHTSKLTNLSLLSVFTLIMRHDLPENFGQNHCPRIKQSPLPVECVAQFNTRLCSRLCFSFPLWPKRNQSYDRILPKESSRISFWGARHNPQLVIGGWWSSCFEKENHRRAMT